MADFIFRISPNIILSSYASVRIGEFAREFGSKFIVIMDPILKDLELADKITQALTDRKINFFVFNDVADGATSQTIDRALALARESYIDGVLAVGGNKALRTGQAIAALHNEKKSIHDFLDGEQITGEPLPLLCLPTTIRETFTHTAAVPVCDSRSRQIRLLPTKKPVCRLSLIDPNFISSLSENQKGSMAIETLCMATEAYLSQKASFFSDMLAEKSVELLGYAFDGPDSHDITTPAEELFAQGGCMASLASATSAPGICSLLALAINARFRISASLVASILFPYFLEDAGTYKTERLKKLAGIFRVESEDDVSDGQAVKNFIENVRMRMAKINLPSRLKDIGIPMEQLALAVEDAGRLPLMATLSKSMAADDLFSLVKTAY